MRRERAAMALWRLAMRSATSSLASQAVRDSRVVLARSAMSRRVRSGLERSWMSFSAMAGVGSKGFVRCGSIYLPGVRPGWWGLLGGFLGGWGGWERRFGTGFAGAR